MFFSTHGMKVGGTCTKCNKKTGTVEDIATVYGLCLDCLNPIFNKIMKEQEQYSKTHIEPMIRKFAKASAESIEQIVIESFERSLPSSEGAKD